MKLNEIQDMWEKDSMIDRSELGNESLNIPRLHSKYFNIYSTERALLRKWEGEFKKLYRDKYEYYSGTLSEEDLKLHGWEPFSMRILRTDIPTYIEADDDIIKGKNMISGQQDKVEFIESIIKSLPSRGYQINSAIVWEKFKMGA